MNRYALTAQQVAELCDFPTGKVRRWRTSTTSDRYQTMSETDFAVFAGALTCWLKTA